MSHKSGHELKSKLARASKSVEIGAYYTHYKNTEHQYKVIALAINEADDKPCVVYQAKYQDLANVTFVRPLDSWLEFIEVNGDKIPRFNKVNV